MQRDKTIKIQKRGIPSQEEQDAVAMYVLKRPLIRPNTSYTKAAFCILLFVSANVLLTILLCMLIKWCGISSLFPGFIQNIYTKKPILFVFLIGLIQFVIGSVIALKPAVIGAIKLYQRYAPEEVRRRCLFKPTCSEYAILAVQKYGVIKGLLKTHDRLFNRCKGRIYMVDEP